MRVGVLSLLRCGVATGANRPDGFIGNHDVEHLLGGNACKATTELGSEDFGFATSVALFECFADANDRLEAASKGGENFFVNQRIGLAENLTALAVAEDHKADEELAQHGRTDLSREGTRHFVIHVLRAEADFLGSTEEFRKLGNRGEGRGNHDFHAVHIFDMGAEALEVADRFGDGHVHLPVGGDNFFAHGCKNKGSLITAHECHGNTDQSRSLDFPFGPWKNNHMPQGFRSHLLRALAICAVVFSPVVEVNAEDLVRSVQKKLAALGHYRGRVDGVPGSMTNAAIRRFQLAEKLKVTGEINHQTLDRLGLVSGAPAPLYSAIGHFFAHGPLARAETTLQVEALRETQEKLAAFGFYAGPHNGLPSSTLISALQDWQRSQGLAPTGRIDAATAAKLELQK
jgi:peptidoglycan hydrolase-like protein with peptidoglycan-binding domain